MATAPCNDCGRSVPPGASKCPACQAPHVGMARKAPSGSGITPPPPEEGLRRGWDAAIFGTIALTAVAGLIAWLV